MSSRSWFFAVDGKQYGPYPEPEFRSAIANGTVRADTLVWADGMAGWQKAGDIAGLMSGASAGQVVRQAGAAPVRRDGYGGGPISIDFEIWDFTWRSLALIVSFLLYRGTERLANIPMRLTLSNLGIVLVLTVGFSFVSGLLTLRKLQSADPAELY